jgi:salicylate hydroxylase
MNVIATRPTVIVVGGGIGGMSTALSLAQEGCQVTLLEKAQEFGEVGAGLQVGPNVMKMFDRLGILQAVNEIAFFPENLLMMDALDGAELVRVDLQDFPERFGYPYATIHRADLHTVITNACAAHDSIQLLPGHKVVSHEQNESEVVVYCEGVDEPFRGDVLIGADGIWSGIRESLVGDGEPRVTGHVAYRAVLERAEVPDDLFSNSVVLWAGPRLHLMHYPLRRGELFNMGAIFHSHKFEQGWNTYGDAEELDERFSVTCEPVRRLVEKIEQWRMWVLRDRDPIDNWTNKRVALLGDSAHPTLQYLAQGAGMAIEDAWMLGKTLEQASDVPTWFRSYESARHTRTARITLISRLYGELYHAQGVERDVRADLLRDFSGVRARESFAWIYDGI